MHEAQEIPLVDSLRGEWIKLPLAVMQDVGPAAQTLGGLLKVTNKQTFSAVANVATRARLPVATVRKHLLVLHDRAWIINHGRQDTRAGHPRRTATIAISAKAKAVLDTYGFLPWWACYSIRRVGRLPWCCRSVLSIIMARLASLAAAVERQDGEGLDAKDIEGSIANMGDDERFRFSLESLERQTGLTRHSIVRAKKLLNHRYGIIRWCGDVAKATKGTANTVHYLVPKWEFRVIVTPAGNETCHLDFRGK